MFNRADIQNAEAIKKILQDYFALLGLEINYRK